MLHLSFDEFPKDPNLIKYCCNKYDHFFINNKYGHNTTGNWNIVDNERLPQLISKGRKYRELKQICFEEAREEIQADVDQFIERISNDKGSRRTIFQNGKLMLCHQ